MSEQKISQTEELKTNPQANLSINWAVRKLKQLDFQIESKRNKMTVMHAHLQKNCNREKQERRKLMCRSVVQEQISQFKKKKKKHESQVLTELEKIRKKNMEQRKDVKQKIEAAKSVCREKNHMAYLKLKKEEQEHNTKIQKNRRTDWQEKRKFHRYILQQEQEGRKQKEIILGSKIKQCQDEKQDHKSKLLKSIQEKQKALEELERLGSSSSMERGTPTDESRKDFRVKIMSKGLTTLITE